MTTAHTYTTGQFTKLIGISKHELEHWMYVLPERVLPRPKVVTVGNSKRLIWSDEHVEKARQVKKKEQAEAARQRKRAADRRYYWANVERERARSLAYYHGPNYWRRRAWMRQYQRNKMYENNPEFFSMLDGIEDREQLVRRQRRWDAGDRPYCICHPHTPVHSSWVSTGSRMCGSCVRSSGPTEGEKVRSV